MKHSTLRLAKLALLALLVLPLAPRRVSAETAKADGTAEEQQVDLEVLEAQRRAVALQNRLRPRVSRYLSAAQEEVEEEKADEAIRLLHKILQSRLNTLERAFVYRYLGFVAYQANAPGDAIGYFEKALEEEALPVKDDAAIRYYIAQLHAQLEHWSEVVHWMRNWLLYAKNPDPVGYYVLAIAQYQLEDPDAAIASIRQAIEIAPVPKESWLRLLAALYAQKQDYERATPVLEELVIRYPKRQYWVQLSLIYGAREDYRTSLAVQQVAYAQGFLTKDDELRRLARSLLYNDLPYAAAKVLDEGLRDGTIEPTPEAYELLANSWIAAREYDNSLPPLRKAAELADDGNLYVRLGQVHMQREQYAEATSMLEHALEKGGLKNRGNAELLLGIAHYNNQQLSTARRYFVRAREYEATREEAERWIDHLAEESGSETGG